MVVKYLEIEDEQILELYKQGDDAALEFLLNKYKNLVRSKTRTYFLTGADHEDVAQEGMIGLFKAIRDYCPEKQVSFRAFAEICVTRQIITAIKTATRQKHIPLNNYVSLNKSVYNENSEKSLIDIITTEQISDPERLFIIQEEMNNMEENINKCLSKFEKEVLDMYRTGESYQAIAKELGRSIKSVDNALQRIKKKLDNKGNDDEFQDDEK